MSLSETHPEFFNDNKDDKPVEKIFKPYVNNEIDPIKSAIRTFEETVKLNGIPAVIGNVGPNENGEYSCVCVIKSDGMYKISASYRTPHEFVKALRGIANILEEKMENSYGN